MDGIPELGSHDTGGKFQIHRFDSKEKRKESDRYNDDLHADESSVHTDEESLLTPVIWCILITETAERFAYFGFRAILVLYFCEDLKYTESEAIALFAFTTALAYFSPLPGSLIADGFLGRYLTILYFASVYMVGLVLLTTGAWVGKGSDDEEGNSHMLNVKRGLTFVGLIFVCVGTGGIKPCVSAFGADQVEVSSNKQKLRTKVRDDFKELETNDNNFSLDDTTAFGSKSNNKNHTPEEIAEEEHHHEVKVRKFFSYFYFCINVGALASMACVPLIRVNYGYGPAFAIPTCFMFLSISLFLSRRHEYVHCDQKKNKNSSIVTTLQLTWWLLLQQIHCSQHWICRFLAICFRNKRIPLPTQEREEVPLDDRNDDSQFVEYKGLRNSTNACNNDDNYCTGENDHEGLLDDAARVLHILPIFAMFPIFWCLYDQQGSVWTLQANRMQLNGLTPEQLLLVNPIEIMLFLPLFGRLDVPPVKRMSWGMLFTAAAFFISGLVESSIERTQYEDDDGKLTSPVNVFWQLPQLTALSVGEIFLSVTGLEFAYSTAPERLKALLLGLFLTTTAFGDTLGGILYSTVFAHMDRAMAMHVCAILMLANLRLFLKVAAWYSNHSFQELLQIPADDDGVELRESRGVKA